MSINGLNPLAYIGVNSPNPAAQIISQETDPTVNDSLNFNLGDIWINRRVQPPGAPEIPQKIFMLTALNGASATWTEIAATDNVLNVLGGTNINVNTVDGDATVNLNPSVVLAGSLTAATNITTTGGNVLVNNGNAFITGGNVEVTNVANNNLGSSIVMDKNRAGGAVQTGDSLGSLRFQGSDGAALQLSSYIRSAVVGTVAAGRVPSQVIIATTPNAVSAAVERVVVNQNGTIVINATTGGTNSIIANNGISTTSFILATDSVNGGALNVNNDLGAPAAGTTSFSNVAVANVPGGGALTIDSQSANPGTQAGFIKIYVGATTAYIPYFTNIAP